MRRHRKAGKKGPVIPETDERFPDDINELYIPDWLTREAFRPHLGKDLVDVLNEYKDLIRNAIAHLTSLDDVLDADRFDDMTKCERAAPVLAYIARHLLTKELELHQPKQA